MLPFYARTGVSLGLKDFYSRGANEGHRGRHAIESCRSSSIPSDASKEDVNKMVSPRSQTLSAMCSNRMQCRRVICKRYRNEGD
jgi:hypothetical protein